MTFGVVLTPHAEADLLTITEYIALENPARARSFVQDLRDRFTRKLSLFPFSGVSVGKVRYAIFARYVVVHTVDETARIVTVVLVTEGHRDWRRLLEGLG